MPVKLRKVLVFLGSWWSLALGLFCFLVGFLWLEDRISLATAAGFFGISLAVIAYGKVLDLERRTS